MWQDHVEDLHRVVLNRAGGEAAILIASSWGVQLSLLYALAHPDHVAALILSGSVPWGMFAQTMDTMSDSALIESLNERAREVDQENRPRFRPEFKAEGVPPGRLEFCSIVNDATLMSLSKIPPLSSLASIKVPVLLVRGLQGTLLDASDEFASVLSNATIASLPEGGHDPWYSDPSWFTETVAEFIHGLKD